MSVIRTSRRQFLKSTAGPALLAAGLRPAEGLSVLDKEPYRLLYSNDLTNTLSCTSPFHKPREPFRKEMLEATVDEVAGTGVDAHLLQPGLGVVPMWKSKVQPLEEHAAWLKETLRAEAGPVHAGCGGRHRPHAGLYRPLPHARTGAVHLHPDERRAPQGERRHEEGRERSRQRLHVVNKFYDDHPQYRLVPGSLSGKDLVLNWAEPEVRAQKFALLQELCENYDIDGLELDFLRTYSYFRLGMKPHASGLRIMTAFVHGRPRVAGPHGARPAPAVALRARAVLPGSL